MASDPGRALSPGLTGPGGGTRQRRPAGSDPAGNTYLQQSHSHVVQRCSAAVHSGAVRRAGASGSADGQSRTSLATADGLGQPARGSGPVGAADVGVGVHASLTLAFPGFPDREINSSLAPLIL